MFEHGVTIMGNAEIESKQIGEIKREGDAKGIQTKNENKISL